MKFTTKVEYTPSPVEMANELWEWDAEQQAEFIYSFFAYHGREDVEMIYQLDVIADELKIFGVEDELFIKRRLEELTDRLGINET